MIFSVYDVDFKQKKDFFFALGYSRAVCSAVVTKQYKGIKNLIKVRLGLNNEKEIKEKLQELRDNYYKMLEINENRNENYKRVHHYIYDCLLSAWHQLPQDKQETILQTVATLNNIDVKTIKKEL